MTAANLWLSSAAQDVQAGKGVGISGVCDVTPATERTRLEGVATGEGVTSSTLEGVTCGGKYDEEMH